LLVPTEDVAIGIVRPLSSTTRSLRLDPTLAIPTDVELADDVSSESPGDGSLGAKETVQSIEVPLEFRMHAVLAPAALIVQPPVNTVEAAAGDAVQFSGNRNTVVVGNTLPTPTPPMTTGTPVSQAMPPELAKPTAAPLPGPPVPVVTEAQGKPVSVVELVPGTPGHALASEVAAMLPKPVAHDTRFSAEKIAATPRASSKLAADVGPEARPNKFLTADKQVDAIGDRSHGTGNAKSSADMQAPLEPTLAQLSDTQPRATVMNVAVAGAPGSPTDISPASSKSIDSTRSEIAIHASDAADVVREVVELTHDFRMRERSSVEVKFEFKDATEVSVRLAYRDGDVQTTFRTDSPELRATLSREWQGYAAAFAQESRGHRVADPVFTSSENLNSPQGRDAGSSAGGDARQQQPSSHPDHSGAHRAASASAFRSSPAVSPSSVQPGAATRITDRLLHVFA
jgi:hypothetical protein